MELTSNKSYFRFSLKLNMKIAVSFLKTSFLIHFKPMDGFYRGNVWKTPVGEWHFASKNQLPGLSISVTLAGNELIQQITFHILIAWLADLR